MIKKVLVANRGEIAVRVLRTCKELGFETVAIYSEADREALHVRFADEAYCIGPPPPKDSYLRGDHILQVALEAGAQLIHPGYGFLADSPEFARACNDAGVTFVGPLPETIEQLSDKAAVRRLARRLRLHILPGTKRSLDDAQLLASADKIGYPLLLKAAAGGSGIGIQIINSHSELETAIPTARREARTTFGDGALYLERLIENARHIEVQLLADAEGHIINLGERECSIQRRHQKLIEEAPSRALDSSLRRKILRSAVRIARTVGFIGAGTVEFLLDPEGRYYFLKVNPRLQVEHTVTEAVTGVDIVKEQLRIASGRSLRYSQKEVKPRGWALECRILAEDPFRNYTASIGRISRLHEPGGPGVRVDSGIYEGLAITPYYDSLLAKLVTWGETRGVAIVRMRRALEEYRIHGVMTNLDLHRALLNSHRFFGGQFHTRFLEEQFVPKEPEEEEYLAAALTTALLDWRRRAGAQTQSNGVANRWKMLGRWELLGGGDP
ncbi:MAG: acetyl-CoA carboxylase biotin carboxylase subunit [Anaerolineaceae bacterium]|nr:MAG: acetyl-CoA carboxylase biotin carboxylase subunit [Anaerolineaceae bacterium]